MSEYQADVANHALLYGYLAREAMAFPAGQAALREAVCVYGRERGARMAQRARQDGLPLTAENYLLYGEWAHPQAEMVLPGFAPEIHLQSRRCPWHEIWTAEGLLAEGAHYCDLVDAQLAWGFAPGLVLDTVVCRMDPAEVCDFYFRECSLSATEQARLERNRAKLGLHAKKDWNYHLGHLYASFLRTLRAQLGAQAAETIGARALAAYAQKFGAAAQERLLADAEQDYDQVRDYAGTPGLEA